VDWLQNRADQGSVDQSDSRGRMFTDIPVAFLQDGSRHVAVRVGSGVANSSRLIYFFAMLMMLGKTDDERIVRCSNRKIRRKAWGVASNGKIGSREANANESRYQRTKDAETGDYRKES
jgi:hypothetical protein